MERPKAVEMAAPKVGWKVDVMVENSALKWVGLLVLHLAFR